MTALAGVIAGPSSGLARAAEPLPPERVQKPMVTAELVTDVSAVAPKETFRVAVRFAIEPRWHMYWRNPGTVGLPTEVTFEAPDGWDFGAIGWPTPKRILSRSGEISYGYDDELILLSEVRAPDNALDGEVVPITAKASWLVCHENCIQGSASLGLSLRVASTPRAERAKADVARTLDAWQGKIPWPAGDPRAPRVTVKAESPPAKPGEKFTLTVTLADPKGRAITSDAADLASAFLPATSEGLELERVDALPNPAGGGLAFRIAGVAGPLAEPLVGTLLGVFQVKLDGAAVAFDAALDVPRTPGPPVAPDVARPGLANPTITGVPGQSVCAGVDKLDVQAGKTQGGDLVSSFLLALAFAFLGGLILNAMPCVLPVLSLKILSLVEQSKEDNRSIWRHGLAYTAGVLVSFGVLGVVLLALKASSWAFQMQDPVFVAVFTAIVFGFALSLFGVFELALPFASALDRQVAASKGYSSSFTYGVFAVLLGTPCTAPFLGPAMAYAFAQPPFEMLLLLLTVGLGLAFPFLVLAGLPGWRRFVPKPGPWLLTFKKVMGFLLVGTAVFLLHTFSGQVSRAAFVEFLIFLTVLAFALFVYGHWAAPERSGKSRWSATVVALGLGIFGAVSFVSTAAPPPAAPTRVEGGITWYEFDYLDPIAEAGRGRTVFIDFTADWCVTCKSNETIAIYTDEVRAAVKELDVLPVKGDFTVFKDSIKMWLDRFGAPSVPLYVVIPAGQPERAFALSSLPSTSEIVAGLCTAGASTATTAAR